jgi:iron complex transport system substrate-binding protein
MKRFSFTILTIICLCIAFISCKPNHTNENKIQAKSDSTRVQIKYAQGLSISDKENYIAVEIKDPQNEDGRVYKYALVEKNSDRKNISEDFTIIETPINSAICMTTLQLSNFIKLDALDKIVGMTSTKSLFNQQMKERLKNGQAAQIGIEGNFDNEIIFALNPDIILVSPFKRGGYESLKDLDIPLVTFLGYKEPSPLGQAEWLKFTGLLLGKEEQANILFDEIEKKYNKLKTLSSTIKNKPTILSGEMRSGNWYVVGGKSFLAEQFRDAGAEYFLKDNTESGGFNLDFESVYSQGANADFWRLLVSFDGDYSYDALKQSDARYVDFKAFNDKKVVYCNLRQKPFYENSPVEPEVVLADLIKAFHPDLLPNYTPVYYEILK